MGDSPYPELYTPGVGWKTMVGAADPALQTNWYYPRAWVMSDGDVVLYGAQGSKGRGVYSIDATGDGAIEKIGTLPYKVDASLPAVMIGQDTVLTLTPEGTLRQIDFSGAAPTYQNVGALGQTRYWSNMVDPRRRQGDDQRRQRGQERADPGDQPGRDLGSGNPCGDLRRHRGHRAALPFHHAAPARRDASCRSAAARRGR